MEASITSKLEVLKGLTLGCISHAREFLDQNDISLLVESLFDVYNMVDKGVICTFGNEKHSSDFDEYLRKRRIIIEFFKEYFERHGLTSDDCNDIRKVLSQEEDI